ncbi:MAG: cell division protein FtsI (penicillin-binding protein 3) [Alphaproteobacteria bacterium]
MGFYIVVLQSLKKAVLWCDKTISKDPMVESGENIASHVQVSKQRLAVIGVVFIGLYGAVFCRVYDLSMPDFFTEETHQKVRAVALKKVRTNIIDRHSVVIATQLKVADLIANPKKIIDPEKVAFQINYLFPDIDADVLTKALSKKKSQYYIVKRNVTPAEQQALHDMGIPGISFEVKEARYYPHENLVSHVIGLTDRDTHGIAGIERAFDDYLTQPNQKKLQLSIDLRIQYILQSALKKSIDTFKAIGGAALVMHVKTGEILGMVSMPDFNPNNRSTMTDMTRFNRASVGAYEPGSVLKVLNTAIALETKTSKISSLYDVSKTVGVGRRRIRDYHAYNDSISVADILRKSSNIGSVKMAERFGPHVQQYYLRKLGLFSRPDIEIQENANSITGKISRIRMMTTSFGHGISVTPLQLVSALSTVVNGGYYTQPTLLTQSQRDYLGVDSATQKTSHTIDTQTLNEWSQFWRDNVDSTSTYFKQMKNTPLSHITPIHGERIFSKKTSDWTRYAMRLVCEAGGSGTRADVYGFPVIGKTGTAEKPSKTGGYNRKSLISSFAGVFPAHKPEYIVYVMVDEPKPNKKISNSATGGIVAAPVVKEVVTRIAPLLNVDPIKYPRTSHAVSDNMLDSSYQSVLEHIKLR